MLNIHGEKICKFNLKMLLSFPIFILLLSCTNKDIELVKNSLISKDNNLKLYTSITIGQALENAFDNGAWTTRKGSHNEKLVIFTGKLSKRFQFWWDAFKDIPHSNEEILASDKLGAILNVMISEIKDKELEKEWKAIAYNDTESLKKLYAKVLVARKAFWQLHDTIQIGWLVRANNTIDLEKVNILNSEFSNSNVEKIAMIIAIIYNTLPN
ncbi:hypothetical protein [Desulfovibrio sp. TomC]|uniref:hypothetical protein n=1 Tax=Desulfovibrio sp. TomC TaxID=1562888 RepID=UPI0012E1A4EE|nr:hypothetical protein [Desulfovibrio sp. TomC]